MWIPTWVIASAVPTLVLIWFVKVWKYDIPKENRAAVADAAREKRELAEYFANQKRGDRLLESLVAAGAPSCILSFRRTSGETVEAGDRPMSPTQTLETYLQFHEAMKLLGDD